MTLGEKIAKKRKALNYTQEQLADILGVSRQSISKWESDIAYPETDKLIKMGKLFECSMDYLLKNEFTDENGTKVEGAPFVLGRMHSVIINPFIERKSKKTIFGMPLYHVGRNARGFLAIGIDAKGVFAIGLRARGIVSFGLLSFGVISFGLLSIGLAALGMLAFGFLSFGAIALGLFAAGAISIGIVTMGALSVGEFSAGALAIGKYAAVGDQARGMIAIGDTKAAGSVYQHIGQLYPSDISYINALLDANVPACLTWAKEIFKLIISY